jgi:hypothetical protein
MGNFDFFTDSFSDDSFDSTTDSPIGSDLFMDDPLQSSGCIHDGEINPATGLPMIGCVDMAGNLYGTDWNSSVDSGIDSFPSSSTDFDDTF